MPGDGPELDSLTTALGDLTDRVVAVGDRYAGTQRDSVASDLYDVERHLRTAIRKLAQVVRELG